MANDQVKLPPGYMDAERVQSSSQVQLPPGYEDASRADDSSSNKGTDAHGVSGSWEPESTSAKVWRVANTPLIPEGRAEREGHEVAESTPSRWDEAHPTLSGIKKGVAGAYADTVGTVRGFTSPLGLATLGAGPAVESLESVPVLAKAAPFLQKIVTPAQKIAGAGFGAEGVHHAYKGAKDIATNGVTPENTEQTLSGLGQAFLAAGSVSPEVSAEDTTRALTSPVRAAASRIPFAPKAIKEVGLGGHERTATNLVGNDYLPPATEALPPAKAPNPLRRIEYAEPTPPTDKPITAEDVQSSPHTSMSKPAQDLLNKMLTDESDKKTTTPITRRMPDKTEPLIPEEKAPESPLGNAAAVKPIEDQIAHAADLVEEGLGGKSLQPKISLRDQLAKSADEPKLSSRPDKAVLQKFGASEGQIAKILPLTNIELRQLAGKLGEDMGDSNIGRGKGDMAAGTHRSREQVLENILKNHSVDEIEKSIDRGEHLPTISGVQTLSVAPSISKPAQKLLQRMLTENGVIGERVAKPRTPGEPLEHGFNMKPAEDLGNAAREGVEKTQGTLPRGDRRTRERSPEEIETQNFFRQARTELGDDASTDEVMKRVDELKANSPRREAKPLILEEKSPASPYLGTALVNAETKTGKSAPQSSAEPLGSLSERVFKALKLSEPTKTSLRNLVHTGALDEDTLISRVVRSTPQELEGNYGKAA